MIHDLTPYPAMKDGGVPWLGPVPEHWDMKRVKTFSELLMFALENALKNYYSFF